MSIDKLKDIVESIRDNKIIQESISNNQSRNINQ